MTGGLSINKAEVPETLVPPRDRGPMTDVVICPNWCTVVDHAEQTRRTIAGNKTLGLDPDPLVSHRAVVGTLAHHEPCCIVTVWLEQDDDDPALVEAVGADRGYTPAEALELARLLTEASALATSPARSS